VTPVLEIFERRLNEMPWGLYKVRRIYTKKGKAMRCVEKIRHGTRDEMNDLFATGLWQLEEGYAAMNGVTIRDIEYARFALRQPDVYPTCEGFYVAAPAFMETKLRGPIERFNQRWDAVLAGKPTTAPVEEQEELAA
jgi:hypothetical protein